MSNEVKPIQRAPAAGSAPANPPMGAMSPLVNQLSLLINSRNPIITVETSEEQRLVVVLERVALQLDVPLYSWSVTTGLGRVGGAALYNSDQPEQALANISTIQGNAIFLLKDFSRYCDNDRISRRLRDLADGCRTAKRVIVILAASTALPADSRPSRC